jgi:hypothetical protein
MPFFDLAEVLTGATVESVQERDADTWGTNDFRLRLDNGMTVVFKSIGGQLEVTSVETHTPCRAERRHAG